MSARDCVCARREAAQLYVEVAASGVSGAHGTPSPCPTEVGPGPPLARVTIRPLPAVYPKVPEGASVCPLLLYPQHVMVPLVRSPQLCNTPAETALKVPDGASACPRLLAPQHVNGAVGTQPTTMDIASGDGAEGARWASACPTLLAPQQVMVASARNPQECLPMLAAMALKVPDGASVRPLLLFPQHVMVPLVRSPQLCTGRRDGAEGARWGVRLPLLLYPQHVMVRLVRSPQECPHRRRRR